MKGRPEFIKIKPGGLMAVPRSVRFMLIGATSLLLRTIPVCAQAAGIGAPAAPSPAAPSPAAIDISAGDLETALASYIRQSGVALLYDPQILRGLRTPGLHGRYDSAQALSLLLQGTN